MLFYRVREGRYASVCSVSHQTQYFLLPHLSSLGLGLPLLGNTGSLRVFLVSPCSVLQIYLWIFCSHKLQPAL